MDIASHGLWGGVGFGRKSKKSYWLAFSFGVAPDLLSFGIFFFERLFTVGISVAHQGRPDYLDVPAYVTSLYNVTHSLVVFSIIFFISWLIFKKPVWEMCAWAFHIILDTFTHSYEFFPTPFLWPLSDFHIDGISWGHPSIFFPNVALLIVAYTWFFLHKRKRNDTSKKIITQI